ncbi:MAG: D-Ala-D-Ala carboxypeptidase family metallohydrolase [Candidatus Nanopelagicales bacterium]|jgi:hypothetical protein
MKITEHFNLSEVENSDTAKKLGIDNSLPESLADNVLRTCKKLEEVRQLFGKRIIISSFYRSPELNSKVGGSKTSAHMDGRACDFNVQWFDSESAFNKIKESGIVLDQCILESNNKGSTWVHLGIEKEGSKPRNEYMLGKKDNTNSTYTRVERS